MDANETEVLNNLKQELESERDWRVAELTKMKLLLRRIQENEGAEYETIFLKMTIPSIYAQWEGFCVASFKILMDYINGKQLDAPTVSYNVLTYANREVYRRLQGKQSFFQKVDFSKGFIKIYNGKISIVGKLDTKSNLNYDALSEILQIFEMDITKFSCHEKTLNKLVNIRNAIAHGKNSVGVDKTMMEDNISLVTELMDKVLLEELEYATEQKYLLQAE